MIKNIIFIQSEKFGEQDYLFVNDKHITSKKEMVRLVSDNTLLKGKFDFTIKKNSIPFSETIKRIPVGFLIKGQLNEKDSAGRFMGFTCFYKGDINKLDNYLNSCFNQIGKSCSIESLTLIKNSISNYYIIRNLLLAAITVLLGYSIFK